MNGTQIRSLLHGDQPSSNVRSSPQIPSEVCPEENGYELARDSMKRNDLRRTHMIVTLCSVKTYLLFKVSSRGMIHETKWSSISTLFQPCLAIMLITLAPLARRASKLSDLHRNVSFIYTDFSYRVILGACRSTGPNHIPRVNVVDLWL
jgi:hypothetical protein